MIFRNGNIKSLFDPSNTEVNTVDDNMDRWVNYRGEVLLHQCSFLRVLPKVGISILKTCLLGIRVLGFLHNHLDAWREISSSSEVIG